MAKASFPLLQRQRQRQQQQERGGERWKRRRRKKVVLANPDKTNKQQLLLLLPWTTDLWKGFMMDMDHLHMPINHRALRGKTRSITWLVVLILIILRNMLAKRRTGPWWWGRFSNFRLLAFGVRGRTLPSRMPPEMLGGNSQHARACQIVPLPFSKCNEGPSSEEKSAPCSSQQLVRKGRGQLRGALFARERRL